jgi:hypothetical protein
VFREEDDFVVRGALAERGVQRGAGGRLIERGTDAGPGGKQEKGFDHVLTEVNCFGLFAQVTEVADRDLELPVGRDDLGNVIGHVGGRGSDSGGDVFEVGFVVEVKDPIHRLEDEDEHYPGGIVSFEYGSGVHNTIIGTSVSGEGDIEVCICAVGRVGNSVDEVASRAALYCVDCLNGEARIKSLMLRDEGDGAGFTEVLG